MEQPRALTPDELRDKLLNHMRRLAHHWAHSDKGEYTIQQRIEGAMFSMLAMMDGCALDVVAFDLVARPHPDDKEYCKQKGCNWIEEGTIISDMLHEHWHKDEPARGEPITIAVGEELFQFTSFDDWVDNAHRKFVSADVMAMHCVCVDANDRVCLKGAEFMRARDEGTFPIRVYRALCEEATS